MRRVVDFFKARMRNLARTRLPENEVSDLEAAFAAPDFYAKPRAEIFDFETQLKVAHLYARSRTKKKRDHF